MLFLIYHRITPERPQFRSIIVYHDCFILILGHSLIDKYWFMSLWDMLLNKKYIFYSCMQSQSLLFGNENKLCSGRNFYTSRLIQLWEVKCLKPFLFETNILQLLFYTFPEIIFFVLISGLQSISSVVMITG